MLILEQVLETHFIRDVGPAPRSVLNKLAEAGEGASSSCTLNCARVPVEGGLQQDSRGSHAQDVQDRAPHCRRAGRLCGTQCVQLGALTVSLLMLGLAALQTAVMAWHTVKAKIGTSAKSLRRDARARYAGRKSWPHCKRTAEQVVITAPASAASVAATVQVCNMQACESGEQDLAKCTAVSSPGSRSAPHPQRIGRCCRCLPPPSAHPSASAWPGSLVWCTAALLRARRRRCPALLLCKQSAGVPGRWPAHVT